MSYIKVNKDLCTGCRYCELMCVFNREMMCDPSKARIRIEKNELEGIENPVVCRQCKKPMCVEACSTKALIKDSKTGVIQYLNEKCTGCKACIDACPFNSIWYDERIESILKCDLCQNNDPQCVKYCPSNALTFIKK